jgi:hypothetical protein
MAQELDSQLKALKYKTRVWHSLKMVKNVLGASWCSITTKHLSGQGFAVADHNKQSEAGSVTSVRRAEKCLWVTRVRQYFSGCDAT